MLTEKLKYIIKKINTIDASKDKQLGLAKIDRINLYCGKVKELEELSFDQIEKFDFIAEVSMVADKRKADISLVSARLDVIKLERHKYAPELNTLHFINNVSIRCPYKIDIDSALKHVLPTYLKRVGH